METKENIKSRRSIRSYKPEVPDKEQLAKVEKAGTWAASGMGRQSPIIIEVTDKEIRDKLSDANRKIGGWPEGFDPFYGAPAVLVVLADKNMPTHVYDGSLVMGNMMLAANDLGLGTCWIHRAKETFEQPEWKEWLKSIGVDGDYEGIGNLIIGYPEGDRPEPKERKENWIYRV